MAKYVAMAKYHVETMPYTLCFYFSQGQEIGSCFIYVRKHLNLGKTKIQYQCGLLQMIRSDHRAA